MAKRDKKLLCLIVLLAVLVRLGALGLRIPQLEHSAFEFGEIAKNIAAGRDFAWDFWGSYEFGPTAFMAPFYPGLLALYYLLFGYNLTGMAALQTIVLGVVVWGLGYVGIALSGSRVGLMAASILALYPEAVFMPQKFVAEPWLLLWQMLLILFGMSYLKSGKRRYIVLAGIMAGLATLTKESAYFYVPFLLVWAWLLTQFSRRLLHDSLLLILTTACVVAPWTLRNYVVMHDFIPVRTGFWYNAWRGNHPGATGTARNYDKINIDSVLDPAYQTEIAPQLQGNELDREQAFRRLTMDFIRRNPGSFLRLSLKRMLFFWSLDPTHPLTGSILYWAPWLLLLSLAVAGVYATRSHWLDYSFWYLLFLVATVTYGLTMVLPRYRIPLLPGLALLAAEGICFLVCALSSVKRVRMS